MAEEKAERMATGRTTWTMEFKLNTKPGEGRKLFALLTGQTEEQVQDDWDWAAEKKYLRGLERDMIWGLY